MKSSQTYPRPDRSDVKRNFVRTADNEALDIGWQEGILSDGRPFRGEYWCEDHVSVLTFFLSRIGLEDASDKDFETLLEKEGLLRFKPGKERYLSAAPFVDPTGNDIWSINVVVGDEDDTFIEGGLPLEPYRKM